MKKFYNYTEQLLLTVMPKSDSVGEVEHEVEEKPTDMFNTTAEEILNNIGSDTVQPDDNVGEMGDNQSESTDGVELECMGDEGLKVKFNGLEMTLPTNVVDAIKSFQSENIEDRQTEDQEEGHEDTETPEEEHEEHETKEQEESEEQNENKNKNSFSESEQYVQRLIESKKGKAVNPWAVCNKSTGGKKKAGKDKFERCVMNVKKKHKVKESTQTIQSLIESKHGNTITGNPLSTWHSRHKSNIAEPGTPIVYKLKRKSEWNEWVVAAYINGKFDEDKSYFTDDKQDAINTMAYLQKNDSVVKG